MKALLNFKFLIASFGAAFLLFGYSLFDISAFSSLTAIHVRRAFIGLFTSAIITGLILDFCFFVFEDSWIARYQYTIGIAVWSVSMCLGSFIYGGGGQGLGASWSVIFRGCSKVVDLMISPSREGLSLTLWGLFSAVQGALIGLGIDYFRNRQG